MVEQEIGKRIKFYRKKRGLTQEELAERVELSSHFISALERGMYSVKLENLVKIMNVLECTADDLFCDSLDDKTRINASRLAKEMALIPDYEQERIFKVVELLVNTAKSK